MTFLLCMQVMYVFVWCVNILSTTKSSVIQPRRLSIVVKQNKKTFVIVVADNGDDANNGCRLYHQVRSTVRVVTFVVHEALRHYRELDLEEERCTHTTTPACFIICSLQYTNIIVLPVSAEYARYNTCCIFCHKEG